MAALESLIKAGIPRTHATKARVYTEDRRGLGLSRKLGQERMWDPILFNELLAGATLPLSVIAAPVLARKGAKRLLDSPPVLSPINEVLSIRPASSFPGEVPFCEEERATDLIRLGWGYDREGHWHGESQRSIRSRKQIKASEHAPATLARGTLWGLLFSAVFFWLPIGAVVVLWWARSN